MGISEYRIQKDPNPKTIQDPNWNINRIIGIGFNQRYYFGKNCLQLILTQKCSEPFAL